MRARLLPFALFAAAAAVSSACGSDRAPSGEGVVESTHAKIIHGIDSTDDQNFVVLIYQANTSAGGYECSGSLITPNLVLTARHCVANVTSEGIGCNADGSSNAHYGATQDPTLFGIFKGTTRPPGVATPDAKGKKIYVDSGNSVCADDVALILLDNPIYFGATIAPVRLDGDEKVGDMLTAIGWGVSEQASNITGYLPNVRLQRNHIPILAVGPSTSPVIAPNMFELGESICQGDSGGPEIDEKTGAIVSVTSIGGNGNPAPGAAGTPQECDDEPASGLKAYNFPTKIQPFKDLIMQAASDSGFPLWIEGQPDPRLAKFGAGCTSGASCQSGICVASDAPDAGAFNDAGPAQICSQACDATNVCPDGFDCTAAETGQSICTVHTASTSGGGGGGDSGGGKSGCATTGAPPNVGWGALLGLCATAFAISRRRRG